MQEEGAEFRKFLLVQRLGERIGNLVFSGTIVKLDDLALDGFLKES